MEQRGNAPVFRITRAAVLKDLDLDLCGAPRVWVPPDPPQFRRRRHNKLSAAPGGHVNDTALPLVDMIPAGFRECVLVQGDARCTPVIVSCKLRSSGDHGFVTEGACIC